MNAIVHFNSRDNLVTSLKPLTKGEVILVDGEEIRINDDIPQYHKISIADIRTGDFVYKYGEVIGKATREIQKGSWAHVHNIESLRGRGDK